MKRDELSTFAGLRISGKGTISKFGIANQEGKKLPTVCLNNVTFTKGTENINVDHIWFRLNKKIRHLDLNSNDIIQFTCSVKPYFIAPEFKKIQGYGIQKINEVEVIQNGNGLSLKEYIDHKSSLGLFF